MRTVFQSLTWKEWHEHKWKLASILAILCSVTLLVATTWPEERDILPVIAGMFALCTVPLAIFLGMGAAAGERSRGTFAFLQSLPIPMWRVALHKLVAGALTIALPPLLVLAFVYAGCLQMVRAEILSPEVFRLRYSGLPTGHWEADISLMLLYFAVSFFVWTSAIGVNRKDEVSAGAVALTTMVGWGLLLMLLWYLLTSMAGDQRLADRSPFNWLAIVGVSTIPGGLFPLAGMPAKDSIYFPLAVMDAAMVHAALAARYVRRFGRISDLEVRSSKTAEVPAGRLDWLGPPRRSPFASIVWKQLRECGPVVLTGVAGILGLFALYLSGNREFNAINARIMAETMGGVTTSLGTIIAMVLGVSVFRGDVAPGLNTFWRSRPIHPDLWFWTKFIGGLVITLATIYAPYLLVVRTGVFDLGYQETVVPIAHLAIFAAAVAMICIVRQAVYAAILSIAVVYLGVVAVWLALLVAKYMGVVDWPPIEFYAMDEGQVAAGFILSFVVSTLLAWLAVRYDWGQKALR